MSDLLPPKPRRDPELRVPCKREERTRWVRTAQRLGLKLEAWVRAVLDGELPPAQK